MKEKQNFLDRWDAKRDEIGEKLAKKEIQFPSEFASGIVCLILAFIIMAVIPSQIAVSSTDVVDGRAFPRLLVIVMIVGSVVVLGQELYRVFIKKQPVTTKTINLLVEIKALVILGILLGTYLICRVTDLFVIGAVFCSLSFLIYFRCRKLSYYVITLTVAVLIWVAFRFGLNVGF